MKKTAIVIAVLAVSLSVLFGIAYGAYEDDFQKAVTQYKEGRYEEAARTLQAYVKERPEGRAYYLLGYANYALGRNAEAAKNFQDAYLVAPEMSPMEFRKSIGIDTGIAPRPKAKKPAAEPAPVTEKPAAEKPAPVAEKPAAAAPKAPAPAAVEQAAPAPPAAEAPAPRPRPRPTAKPAEETAGAGALAALGLIPLIVAGLIYLLYSISVFMVGRKADTGKSWLAFVPVVNFVWPLVGAANKSKIWILLAFTPAFLYLWMLVAERFGKSKVLGLLFGLLVGVPLVNVLLVKILFKEAGAAGGAAKKGFELPDIPEEMPELPDVPGMEEIGEEAPFEAGEAPAGGAPAEEDFFGGGFGEEETAGEAPPEEPAEDFFGADEEEAPSDDMGGFEIGEAEDIGERAPTLDEMGLGEEAPEELLEEAEEEAPFEEMFGEEAAPVEEAIEEAPQGEGEPWELSEEGPMEYEAAEGEEGFEGELPPMTASAGLMGIGDLFSMTWGVYKRRVGILLGLILISVIVGGAAAGVFVGIGFLLSTMMEGMKTGIMLGSGVVAAIAGIIAFGWGYGAVVHAVADERLGFGDSLRRSWQKVGSFIWAFLLVGFIPVGGLGLFIVPGILFWVWFTFALYVLAKEGVMGMGALLKSKEYVKGYFGGVFVRLLLLTIISMVLGFVPFIGGIFSFLFAPFMMLFIYNMYVDLGGIKGKFAFAPSGGQKVLYPALGVLGLIVGTVLVFLLITAVFGAAILGSVMTDIKF